MIEKPRRSSSPRPRRRNPSASANRQQPRPEPRHDSLPGEQRINKKFFRFYLCGAYALITFTLIYFSCCTYNSYMEKKRLEMGATAYELEMHFDNTLDYAETLLNYINRQIISGKITGERITEILSSFTQASYGYNSIKDTLSVGMFYWVDAQKHLIASSAGPLPTPVDLSNRDYLETAKEDPWKLHAGAPVVGAVSGQYVLPAGVAAVDINDRYVGTSVVSFKIQNLVEKFSRLTSRYKTDFALLDLNNKVLMESTPGLFSEDQNLMSDLQLSGRSLREELVSDFSPLKRKGSYIIIRNVEKYPYKIIIGYRNQILSSELLHEFLPHFIEWLIITIFFIAIWNLPRLASSRRS